MTTFWRVGNSRSPNWLTYYQQTFEQSYAKLIYNYL